MIQKIKNRNHGFTIVETLIVLAIAGLIILIVLLAVPALQRTSRNTNIKSDASAVAGGVTEFEGNNAGANPTAIPSPDPKGGVAITGAGGSVPAEAKIQASDVVTTTTVTAAAYPTSIASGSLIVHIGQTCGGVVATRAVAIWYPIETSTNIPNPTASDCVDS